MSESRSCPKCGATLPGDAPDAPCQACLMQIGLENWTQNQQAAGEFAQTAVQSPDFDAPTIERMAELFPQFVLQKMLGVGGMGAVYLAKQRSLDRDVAIKIIKPSAADDGGFAERFAREAKALARLSHHNVVTVHDFGEVDGMYFFVMEYVDGVNLRQAMREGQIEPQQALSIIPQVCDALQYAHDEGIVHRDIKPENILLDKRGRVKIADFGLAKLLRRAPVDVTLTSAHQVMGTMHYMAPEQLERPLDVDHRADIYSLGVVLYEMMTGELPIGRFELPSERHLDARLDGVVLRTLERKPEKRYEHISELKTDVESISHNFHAGEGAAVAAVASPVAAAVISPEIHAAQTMQAGGSGTVSVPFTIHRENTEGARGLLRYNGRQLEFEYTVTDDAEWEDAFSGFKAGAGRAVVPLFEIASATFETLWFGARIGIQANSMDAVAKVPGHDRGRVDLSIEKRDRESALTLVNSLRRSLGQAEQKADSSADEVDLTAHKGTLMMGAGFCMVGALSLLASFILGFGTVFMWVGVGLIIGGGTMLGQAFNDENRIPRSLKADPSNLVTGSVLLLIGLVLMLGAMFFAAPGYLMWVGLGLALGGAGTYSGAWPTAANYRSENAQEAATGVQEKPIVAKPTPEESNAPDLAQRARLSGIAKSHYFFGILNYMVAAGLFAFLAWALTSGKSIDDDIPIVAIVLASSLGAPSLICGWIMCYGAKCMTSLRSRGWAIAATVCAMMPLTGFFPFSFFFGVWGITVLTTRKIKREFALERNRVQYAD